MDLQEDQALDGYRDDTPVLSPSSLVWRTDGEIL